MNDFLLISLLFGSGVIIETFLLLRHRTDSKLIFKCTLLSLLFSIILFGVLQHSLRFSSYLMFYFTFFTLCIAILFKKTLIPYISEMTVLVYTLAFWYIIAIKWPSGLTIYNISVIIILILTIITLFTSLLSFKLNKYLKLMMYIWFLFLTTFFLFTQFNLGIFALFFNPNEISIKNPLEFIVGGMTFTYLLINITYLIALIPLRSRYQTMDERTQQINRHITDLTDRFSNIQIPPLYMITIISLLIILLLLNYFLKIVPDLFLVNALILFAPRIFSSDQIKRNIPQ